MIILNNILFFTVFVYLTLVEFPENTHGCDELQTHSVRLTIELPAFCNESLKS